MKNLAAHAQTNQALLDLAVHPTLRPEDFAARLAELDEQGVDLDARDGEGRTALMIVAERPHGSERLGALLRHGAQLLPTDHQGMSALHRAARAGNDDAVNRLVAEGADLAAQSRDGLSAMHHAAIGGSPAVVAALARAGVAVDTRDRDGRDPLHHATANNPPQPAVVGALIRQGLGVASMTASGEEIVEWAARRGYGGQVAALAGPKGRQAMLARDDELADATPYGRDYHLDFLDSGPDRRGGLHLAARHGQFEAIDYLLSQGAKADRAASDGERPIHAAAASRHVGAPAAIERLAREKIDLDRPGHEGSFTPLMMAAGRDLASNVEALLRAGAKVDARHFTDRRSAADCAALMGAVEALRALIAGGASLTPSMPGAETPLLAAAHAGQVASCEALLRAGAPVDALDALGATAFSRAVKMGHERVARLLLDHGADVNAKDNPGRSPALWAAHRDNGAMIGFLVEAGADIDAPSQSGYTPLGVFATKGNLEACETLLRAKADPNKPDSEGRAPMSHAARSGNVALARAMLDAGGDPLQVDKRGYTPILAAASTPGAARALLDIVARAGTVGPSTADGRSALQIALLHTTPKEVVELGLIEALAARGAPLDALYPDGTTALMRAAEAGDGRRVETLLRAGANPDLASPAGATAFHLALLTAHSPKGGHRAGAMAAALLLADAMSDVNAQDHMGRAPLHWACRYNDPSIASRLIARGADVNAVSRDGERPLPMALIEADVGHPNARGRPLDMRCVDALLAAGADPNGPNEQGVLPLVIAVYAAARDPSPGSPLRDSRDELCVRLVRHGADTAAPAARDALRLGRVDLPRALELTRDLEAFGPREGAPGLPAGGSAPAKPRKPQGPAL